MRRRRRWSRYPTWITDVEAARDESEAAKEPPTSIASALEAKAAEFSNVMDTSADGDLTQRMATDSDYDAMVDIAESFNEMIAELERTVNRIEGFAGTVDSSTETISASAQEVRSASESVSESVQQIAEGADEQNRNIQQVSDEMTDLSATVEEITSSTTKSRRSPSRPSMTASPAASTPSRPPPKLRHSNGSPPKLSNRWSPSQRRWSASARSRRSSTKSRSRRTCSRSTRTSKPLGPVRQAKGSPSSPASEDARRGDAEARLTSSR